MKNSLRICYTNFKSFSNKSTRIFLFEQLLYFLRSTCFVGSKFAVIFAVILAIAVRSAVRFAVCCRICCQAFSGSLWIPGSFWGFSSYPGSQNPANYVKKSSKLINWQHGNDEKYWKMWWHFLEIQEWVGLYQRFPVLSSRNRNTETLGLSLVSEPDLVSKFRPEESRNQSRNRDSDNQSIGIGTGIVI